MDIFNSNRKLEELAIYGVDWGIFNRHNIQGPIIPFMFLQHGKEHQIRMLMTDGDPVEFAKGILSKEEKPFEQFIIGFEGYLRDDNNNRVDSIIIHGFDVTQDKGVSLGQMFNPMENGGFKKIDTITFLGNPDLIIPKQNNPNVDYSTEEIGFNAVAIKNNNDQISYMAVFSHDNPSVIANTIKRFLRSKFGGENRNELSGNFELNIPDGLINDERFLEFLVTNFINEELATANVIQWQDQTKRPIEIICKYGDKVIFDRRNIETEIASTNSTEDNQISYEKLNHEELDREYFRIISIPNARTNINALTQMSVLMQEYKKRGLEMPKSSPTPVIINKKWWEFWK